MVCDFLSITRKCLLKIVFIVYSNNATKTQTSVKHPVLKKIFFTVMILSSSDLYGLPKYNSIYNSRGNAQNVQLIISITLQWTVNDLTNNNQKMENNIKLTKPRFYSEQKEYNLMSDKSNYELQSHVHVSHESTLGLLCPHTVLTSCSVGYCEVPTVGGLVRTEPSPLVHMGSAPLSVHLSAVFC